MVRPDHECKLMDEFGVLVQFLLGVLCFSTLIYKRVVERPQRSWQVWFMDTSKQAVGSGSAHILNVVLASGFGATEHQRGRACAWYMVNIVLDNTLGVLVMYATLCLLETLAFRFRCAVSLFATGSYGNPPSWWRYLGQLLVWCCIVVWMKTVMTGFMVAAAWPLGEGGAAILSVADGRPRVQLFFVMIVVPVVTNTLQFQLVDCAIKGKVRKERQLLVASFESEHPGFDGLLEAGGSGGGTTASEDNIEVVGLSPTDGPVTRPNRASSFGKRTSVGERQEPLPRDWMPTFGLEDANK